MADSPLVAQSVDSIEVANRPSDRSAQDTSRTQAEQRLAAAYHTILQAIGEDPRRAGLLDTPARAAKAMLEATAGYAQDVRAIAAEALFDVDADGTPPASSLGMVFVRDSELYQPNR